jgi:hypothetical protein
VNQIRIDNAYESNGLYWVEHLFEGQWREMSVRSEDTTGTPLSQTEIDALKLLKEAEAEGKLARKALRDRGKVREQEQEAAFEAGRQAREAEEAAKPKPPKQPNPAELLARIEALTARVAALEAAQGPATPPTTPPGKAK